jgi:D-beta-D-heptose 7-phosphate kinase/D-beta-D-heptose 1-phosphate adenosyltransferase
MTDALPPDQLIARFSGVRILCVGDIMLDRYVYGAVSRISPEAPVPVMASRDTTAMLGGAGNVVRNISALGGRSTLAGVVGSDDTGFEVLRLIGAEALTTAAVLTMPGRPTTLKTRFVAGTQQLLRVDTEDPTALDSEIAAQLAAAAADAVAAHDVVVLSDYAKGVVSPPVVRPIIAAANALGRPVIADPKRSDFSEFDGATLLTPNAKELSAAAGIAVVDDASAVLAADAVLARTTVQAILVTRAAEGMTLVRRHDAPLHFRAEAREVFDVSGAGDTVTAVVALGLAAGASLDDSCALANTAGGIVVGKAATAVIRPDELTGAFKSAQLKGIERKLASRGAALDLAEGWRRRGLRVGFTNGCFDVLHPGHVSLLRQARDQCDRLIVGLNSDASVRRLKGPERPVNGELARAIVLAALATVDAVVVFDEDTPMALIEALRPEVLVKGADYTVGEVVGAPFVQAYGGRIVLANLVPGESTTGVIARMRAGKAEEKP